MKVLQHAIDQFRARCPKDSKKSDEWIAGKLRKIVENDREWELKPKKRLMQLLNHDCEIARYFRAKNGMMVVVVGDMIKTIHNGAAKLWQLKAQ